MKFRQLFVLAAVLLGMASFAPLRAAESITVRFKTSCSEAVQKDFDLAVTYLHSFEYLETARRFADIAERDPDCAMARWGQAMSIWHPLWAPPSGAELEAGAEILDRTDGLPSTPREQGYLAALQSFFSSNDTTTHLARARMFRDGMRQVYRDNLDDPEAAVFYALALLASADPRDKSYSHQFESGALLNWVGESQPTHPGVLHYTIHSYDFPGLAHLALNAAKIYAAAAPDSAHAQHMPSHIFTRMGLWEASLASNHDSTRSAAEYTIAARLPGHYDEGLHSMDYLMYAMLQTARDDEAGALLNGMRDIDRTDTDNFKVAYTYASSPARYVLERRRWDEARDLQLIRPDNFEWQEFPWALSIYHFARAVGAARDGEPAQARSELAAIESLQGEMEPSTVLYWNEQIQVHIDMARAWIAFEDGDHDTALRIAAATADREDAVDKHPVTPGEVIPAREMYAEMLLRNGQPERALAEYQRVLAASPNRLNALLGAAAAANRAGQPELGGKFAATAAAQAAGGGSRPLDL